MKSAVALCVRVTIALFLVAAGGCGGAYEKLQYYPPAARGMAQAQLATIIPDNTAMDDSSLFGMWGNFLFNCPIDNLVKESRSSNVSARLFTIQALDSAAGGNAQNAMCAVAPLYVAPGKYEFRIYWKCSIYSMGSPVLEAANISDVQLDARAGKTYVLSGKATNHGQSASVSFKFTEKQ
jgi:hypothetical protein